MGFHHGLSGLNGASKNLDVIGHNIANSNTVGFKNSRTEFNEMVASAMGAASNGGTGIGVSVAAVSQQFSQGVVTPTANGLDMAINGDGFFVVKTPSGTAYTRNGAFQLNKDGFLITANGDRVQGYALDSKGMRINNSPDDLSFPTGAPIDAKQTSKITAIMNLDARANWAAGDPDATPPIPATPRATYGTSLQVYDSLGVAHSVSLYFEKTPVPNPNYDPSLGQTISNPDPNAHPDLPIGSGNPNPGYDDTLPTTIPNPDPNAHPNLAGQHEWKVFNSLDPSAAPVGTMGFDATGKLTSSTPDPFQVQVTPANGAHSPFSVEVDLSKTTQYGSSFSVARLTQDGYASGELTAVNVSSDGTLLATYSNGVTRAEAQITLARFTNTQGLEPAGNNNWVATFDAGPVIEGTAGSGSFGTIQGSALEESNVDLTAQLVGMMTAQRAYQANAQTIKTQDQIFSTLVNLR